jgi:high-affinity iron transporter
VSATATRITAFAALAFAVTLGALWLSSRDDVPPLTRHIAVAPPAQTTVFGTHESAQETADSVIENSPDRPDLTPLKPAAFRIPIARYRRYAVGQARVLARETGALADAPGRRAWLRAYATYLRIGAAYGALGALDDEIEGDLHGIERALWAGRRPPAPTVRGLKAAVARLPQALRAGPLTPLDYATRAHEILEDAQRDQLSGVAPRWSGAGVLATAADLDATFVVIRTLHGLLAGRGDALPQVQTRLVELRGVLTRIRRAHRGWPSEGRLSRAEHERLTGTLGATLEALSTIPGALETALPPAIPAIR